MVFWIVSTDAARSLCLVKFAFITTSEGGRIIAFVKVIAQVGGAEASPDARIRVVLGPLHPARLRDVDRIVWDAQSDAGGEALSKGT